MTKGFNNAYTSIISEVLSGSKKRNKRRPQKSSRKRPAMGRKKGRLRDVDHITPMPRRIKKHAAHIRPVNKTIGNETGVHSKRPDAKPVYSKKNNVKPYRNSSQRSTRKPKNTPYSSEHEKSGTRLNHADRREKILKNSK